MVVYLHGTGQSTCTRRVAAVCKELGVEYEIKQVDWANIKTPEHLAIQPFGQVPVMEVRAAFIVLDRRD